MNRISKDNSGLGLVSILVVMVLFAAIVYGGVLFFDNNSTTQIKTYEKEKVELDSIQKQADQRNQIIQDILDEDNPNKTFEQDMGEVKDKEAEGAPSESRENKNISKEQKEEEEGIIIKDVPVEKWRTYKNENYNFSILYHRDWYYTNNYKDARELGYELIIGFAASSSVWEMSRPYPIELIIASGDKELDQEIKYSKVIYNTEAIDFILGTADKEQYKDLINQMAATFEYNK